MSGQRLVLAVAIMAILIGAGAAAILAIHKSTPSLEVYQQGVASWYGREEHGKLTASGETFNRFEYTAAHRKLPFNTVVRVINRDNGRAVQVRINDRGPYVKGRVLDLSEAAAESLDMKKTGVAPVKIEIVPPPGASLKSAPTAPAMRP